MITMEEINTIITNAFNYYNGRINVFNIAKLEINFMDLPSSSNGGESLSPNIVRIYPNIIRRYYTDETMFKINLVIVIIHELYHTDQLILYTRLETDPEYRKDIESAVEVMTASYLSSHKDEICNLAMVDNNDLIISTQDCREYINAYAERAYLYNRRTYVDHICMIIDEITSPSPSIHDRFACIIYAFEMDFDIIAVEINDDRIIIKNGIQCASYEEVNNFFYEKFFKYNMRQFIGVSLNYDIDKKSYILKVKCDCYNTMCKLIQKQE